MPADHIAPSWAIRSALVAVADLDRSTTFYRELGQFDEIFREDAVVVLGGSSPESIVLILRETRGIQTRHGQQSLGIRSITFNVRSVSELDRIEALLRDRNLFTTRRHIADDASELLRGRDPDNLPLVFVCYAKDKTIGSDYYRAIVRLMYTLDA